MIANTVKGGKKKGNKESFFSWMEKSLKLDQLLGPGGFMKYVPHVVFLTCLGLIHIWHDHQAEKVIRKIDTLETEVEDLRADYTTLKARYMYTSKQTEVAKKVKKLGLKEIDKPLKQIVLSK